MDDGTKVINMSIQDDLIKKFGNNLTKNENLSKFSWFNLGGDAEYFFKARNKDQLIEFLKDVKKKT